MDTEKVERIAKNVASKRDEDKVDLTDGKIRGEYYYMSDYIQGFASEVNRTAIIRDDKKLAKLIKKILVVRGEIASALDESYNWD